MKRLTDKLQKLISLFLNKETILYLIFGVLTTVINFVVARLCYDRLPISSSAALIFTANTIAWVAAVIFAFITNKLFVFESKSMEHSLLIHEIVTFFSARLLSLGIDLLGMYLLVDVAGWDFTISKLIMNVIVIILNYVLSKLFIFNKTGSSDKLKSK